MISWQFHARLHKFLTSIQHFHCPLICINQRTGQSTVYINHYDSTGMIQGVKGTLRCRLSHMFFVLV